MAAVLRERLRPAGQVAIISHDETPVIQAIETAAPDLPTHPGVHQCCSADREDRRRADQGLDRVAMAG
jgi:hypothetical protein